MLIDSHLHLNDKEFDHDLQEVIDRAKSADVRLMVVNGYDIASSQRALDISHDHPGVYATCGIHPSEASKVAYDSTILQNLLNDPKVIGIGEIGLDYYWDDTNKSLQQALFREQLALATELNLPVIIHSRNAIQDTFDILYEYPVRGIIHCYSSSYEMALRFVKRGFLIGIGGVVTFKNAGLREIVEKMDLNYLVTETDSPYLAPHPHRGKRNEPQNIPLIIQAISQLKHTPEEEVIQAVYHNFTSIFKIKESS